MSRWLLVHFWFTSQVGLGSPARRSIVLRWARADRADSWREIEGELQRFQGGDGFVGPCELWVGAGTRYRVPPAWMEPAVDILRLRL